MFVSDLDSIIEFPIQLDLSLVSVLAYRQEDFWEKSVHMCQKNCRSWFQRNHLFFEELLSQVADTCRPVRYSYFFHRQCYYTVLGCLFWFIYGQLQFQWWKEYWKNIWQEQDCNLSYEWDTHEIVGNLFFGDFGLGNGLTVTFVVTVAVNLDSEGHKITVKIMKEIKKM